MKIIIVIIILILEVQRDEEISPGHKNKSVTISTQVFPVLLLSCQKRLHYL